MIVVCATQMDVILMRQIWRFRLILLVIPYAWIVGLEYMMKRSSLMDDARRKELGNRYRAATHAMQSGVALKLRKGGDENSPKNLRVGVNSAMVDSAALAKLLIANHVITEEQYFLAMVEGMEDEAKRYEDELGVELA